MAANDVVRAHIDRHLKEEAAAILGAAGLTVSDAFRMLLVRTVAEKALPFDPLVSNEETIEAMKAVMEEARSLADGRGIVVQASEIPCVGSVQRTA